MNEIVEKLARERIKERIENAIKINIPLEEKYKIKRLILQKIISNSSEMIKTKLGRSGGGHVHMNYNDVVDVLDEVLGITYQ